MARREEESAISLFSFQDIITSITGIMFLVVLLLVLIMLTSYEPSSPVVQTENVGNQEMIDQIAKLKQQIDELKNVQTNVESELEKLRKLDPDAWTKKLIELEEKLKQQKSALQKSSQELKEKQAAVEENLQKIKEFNQLYDPQVKKIKQLADERLKLQKAIQDQQAANEQKKKIMDFSIENNSNKSPLLLEISKDGFQVLKVSNNEFHDFRVSNDLNASLNKFWSYLNANCDPHTYYVTLVIKPSGFMYAENISDMLKKNKYERGLEILPDEKTSIFEGRKP